MLNALFNLTLTFIIFFTPFAFGTVQVWSITILQLSILFLFFIYILRLIKNGVLEYRKNIINIFFFVFITYTVFQLLSNITNSPYRTLASLKISVLYFMLFLAMTNFIQKKTEIAVLMFKVILAGFFVSILGILQYFTDSTKIYWIKSAIHGKSFGPFINENHFSFYVSVIALVTFGNIFANIHIRSGFKNNISFKQKLLNTLEKFLDKSVFFSTFVFIIIIISLFLTKSRGGIFFFGIALIFFSISILFRKKARDAIWLILVCIAISCLLLNWVGIEKALEEVKTILYSEGHVGRVAVLEEARYMLNDYPLFGVGLGGFSVVFRTYRTGFELLFFDYLHNDIFQLLTEVGTVGFIIIALPFLIFLLQMFRAIARTESMYKYYISLGILASFFYMFLHGLVSFAMRLNAISALFVILLSLAILTINLRHSKSGRDIVLPIQGLVVIRSGVSKLILYILSTLIFFYLSFYISKPLIAHELTRNARNAISFERGIKFDPENDALYYDYYQFMLMQHEKGLVEKKVAYSKAEKAIDTAMSFDPYNTDYIIAKGWLKFKENDYEDADSFFEKAILMEPDNPRLHLIYAYTIFWQWLEETDEVKKDYLLKKGLVYYENAKFLTKHTHLYSVINDKFSYTVLKESLRQEGVQIK